MAPHHLLHALSLLLLGHGGTWGTRGDTGQAAAALVADGSVRMQSIASYRFLNPRAVPVQEAKGRP